MILFRSFSSILNNAMNRKLTEILHQRPILLSEEICSKMIFFRLELGASKVQIYRVLPLNHGGFLPYIRGDPPIPSQ